MYLYYLLYTFFYMVATFSKKSFTKVSMSAFLIFLVYTRLVILKNKIT